VCFVYVTGVVYQFLFWFYPSLLQPPGRCSEGSTAISQTLTKSPKSGGNLLKPGKLPDDPKNFQPISFLCHTYKWYEKLILNRLKTYIDNKLIKEKRGFRPGRSCTGQILGLIQHIENGYEEKKITRVVFIDLTVAYDKVNHNLMISKIKDLTKDNKLARSINTFLETDHIV